MPDNGAIARVFKEIADLLEINRQRSSDNSTA